jgi:hypothetical protein
MASLQRGPGEQTTARVAKALRLGACRSARAARGFQRVAPCRYQDDFAVLRRPPGEGDTRVRLGNFRRFGRGASSSWSFLH